MIDELAKTNSSLPWARLPQSWGHPWHSMCSYLGAFPPSLVHSLLVSLTNEGDVVLDPFCGRGTTLLECRLQGRLPLASDLSPLAIALAQAKNTKVDRENTLARIDTLERRFDLPLFLPEAAAQEEGIQEIYHPFTLARLCYLRRCLLQSSNDIDRFLIGLILGIMHGAERKDGDSQYASISMPNTFSMAPGYVRRFVQQNHLQRVERDVFALMRQRVDRLFRVSPVFSVSGHVAMADARLLDKINVFTPYLGRVKLVLTSPPYLNVVGYTQQNWIRMWFLGFDTKRSARDLDDMHTLNAWLSFMEQVCETIARFLSPEGIAVLVIGDVRVNQRAISPTRELIRRLSHRRMYKYLGCLVDNGLALEKTTRVWGNTRGQATEVERLVFLSHAELKGKDSICHRPLNNADYRENMFQPNWKDLAETARDFASL